MGGERQSRSAMTNRGLAAMAAVAAMLAGLTSVAVLGGIAHADPPPITFGPPTSFSTGAAPTSVAVGDLNGNSALDMIVVNYLGQSVSVLLGDGVGGFAPATTYPTGSDPYAVALGDLNGDTFLDMVVTSYLSNSVSVRLGDGAGSFGARTDLPAGAGAFAVAIGDVKGDTHPDLAVANEAANTVSVLLGDGTGGFAPKTDLATGVNPAAVGLVDLNGDGALDLIVANYGSSTASVRLGDGVGGFGAMTSFATAPGPYSMALRDLNGDTVPDLVTSSFTSDGVSVLFGDGSGGFGAKTDVAVGAHTISVAVGDLNGDTLPDLAVANWLSDSISVLPGDGTGGFGAKTELPTGASPRMVTVADLSGDGRLDLAVANGNDSPTVSVLLNTTGDAGGLPGAPTIIRNATAANQSATVSWTAPVSDGGSPISGYVVTPYIVFFPLPSVTFASTATTETVTGLRNGTGYRFKVAAINAFGTGPTSTVTNEVTPMATVPGAPTIIRNATAGDQSATVSWTAPVSDGGSPISGYVVTPYRGFLPLPAVTFASTATTATVTGLSNGKEYRFRVQAINALGIGGYSKVTNPVTPSA